MAKPVGKRQKRIRKPLAKRTDLNLDQLSSQGGVAFPPEVNSASQYSGAGNASMNNADSAWQNLSTELSSAAGSFNTVISSLQD